MSVSLNQGGGTYQPAVSYSSGGVFGITRVTTADMDGDGSPDLVSASESGHLVSVRLNFGDGTFGALFTYPSGINPTALVAADLNGDGKVDVAVANADGQRERAPAIRRRRPGPADSLCRGRRRSQFAGDRGLGRERRRQA